MSWAAPPASRRHGVIVSYTVGYQALSGEDTERHKVSGIGAAASVYVIQDLERWTEYQVWVRAHTKAGPGPESAPVRMKTQPDGRLTPEVAKVLQKKRNKSTTIDPATLLKSKFKSKNPAMCLCTIVKMHLTLSYVQS